MARKPKHIIINLVIYPIDIVASFAQSDEEISKLGFDSEYIKLGDNDQAATYFIGGRILMRFRNYPSTAEDEGDLAHEIFHAVHYAMDYVGMRLTDKSKESYSHLIGYVTTQIKKATKK